MFYFLVVMTTASDCIATVNHIAPTLFFFFCLESYFYCHPNWKEGAAGVMIMAVGSAVTIEVLKG